MQEIEIRVLGENGEHILIKALAVIAIVRSSNGVILNIRENGDLTEEWWRAFPKLLQDTIECGLEERRKINKLV